MTSFAKQSYELLKKGFKFEPKIGLRVARGFADLGFEEFTITNNNKMISMFTGGLSTIPDNFKEHFFPLFTVEELLLELYRKDLDVLQITSPDQRVWTVELSNKKHFTGSSIQDSLLSALLDAI